MNRIPVPGLLVATAILLPHAGQAQARPDFSGPWTYAADRGSEGAAKDRPNFGMHFVAKQQDNTLTIERISGTTSLTEVYNLDGTETKRTLPSAAGQPDRVTSWKTSWDGAKLIIFSTSIGPGEGGSMVTTETRRVLWLEAPDTLVVETTFLAPQPRPLWSSVYKKGTPQSLAPPITPAKATMQQMAWLDGVWSGASGPAVTEERWTPAATNAIFGVSRTLRDGRVVAFEFLRIVERAGGLVYIAQPGGRPPTEFTLTAIDAESATFENPAHDFPKKIRYAKQADGSLEATISGLGGPTQTFKFKRQ